jgi:hypothetical protein
MAIKKQQSKQPANTLRCGNIKATIWKNTSEKGSFYATDLPPENETIGLEVHLC